MNSEQFEAQIKRMKAILDAVEPFACAAEMGRQAEEVVRKTDMTPVTALLGIPGYVAVSVAQDRISWADWKRLLEAYNSHA